MRRLTSYPGGFAKAISPGPVNSLIMTITYVIIPVMKSVLAPLIQQPGLSNDVRDVHDG
jgi:hypothetical protein